MVRTLWICVVAHVAACAPELETDDPVGKLSSDGVVGKLSSHWLVGKMSSNGLVLHDAVLRRLSPAPLSQLAPALAVDAGGSELLAYAARCALRADQAITIDARSFPGALGLAPAWLHEPCDASCRGWISACLIAHANVPGVTVPIWLRGDHPALGTAAADTAFPVQEAAFYGDVFVAADQPLAMYACLGRGTFPSDYGENQEDLVDDLARFLHHRMCSATNECGVAMSGPCNDRGWPDAATCDHDAGDAGGFGACHVVPAAARTGSPDQDELFANVITVYVAE